MQKLISTIDEIAKYGLGQPEVFSKIDDLVKHLARLNTLYYDTASNFDNSDYPGFENPEGKDVLDNIRANFPDFGYYHILLNGPEIKDAAEIAVGDATDDLNDIIRDLMEVKWRLENNSEVDGLWFFRFIFKSHTQQHLLGLLEFIRAKWG